MIFNMNIATFSALQWNILKATQPSQPPAPPVIMLGQTVLRADAFQPAAATVRSGVNTPAEVERCAAYLRKLTPKIKEHLMHTVDKAFSSAVDYLLKPLNSRETFTDPPHKIGPEAGLAIIARLDRIMYLKSTVVMGSDGKWQDRYCDLPPSDLAATIYAWLSFSSPNRFHRKYLAPLEDEPNMNYLKLGETAPPIFRDYFSGMTQTLFKKLDIQAGSEQHELLVLMTGLIRESSQSTKNAEPVEALPPPMTFPKTAKEMDHLMDLVYSSDWRYI
jgi:hypothetical protein